MSPSRPQLGMFLVAAALLAIGISRDAWPWIADDAFISLRFAERLVTGHGLTWTDGERVEGYSNLAWVLLSAGLGALGCDWITAVRWLGITCTIATLAVLTVLMTGDLVKHRSPTALAVPVLAAQSSLAVWAIGGLEVPLALLLVALTMLGLARGLHADAGSSAGRWLGLAGASLAILAWTRPDGPLWAAVAAVTVMCLHRRPPDGERRPRLLAALAWLLLPPVFAVVLQLGFRIVWHGDWLPNTGRAKVGASAASRAAGLNYLWSAAIALRALLLPALLGVLSGLVSWRRPNARPLLLFATLGVVVWCAYLLQVGGDVFPQNRLLVPALAPLAVMAAHGIGGLAGLGRIGIGLAWLVGAGCIVLGRIDGERPATDVRQQLSTWEWQALATGDWLGRAFREQRPLLAVDAAGAVPFASRLPCLDMLGLCDRTIAMTPVPPGQPFIPGHNRGNGAYVLSRAPDLVLFWLPPGNPQPRWLSGAEMENDPGFLADYRIVLFQTGAMALGDGSSADLRITAWVRVEGRAGAVRQGDRIVVPGHLLGSYRQPRPFRFFTEPLQPSEPGFAEVAHEAAIGAAWWQDAAVTGILDASSGRTHGRVRRHGSFQLPQMGLAPGRWRVGAKDLPAGVTLSLVAVDPNALVRHGDDWLVAATNGSTAMTTVVCSVPESVVVPFTILEFVLQRSD